MLDLYTGAYNNPLRRSPYDSGDMTPPDMGSPLDAMPATSNFGGAGNQPSRFQSFLGSLGQAQKKNGLLGVLGGFGVPGMSRFVI